VNSSVMVAIQRSVDPAIDFAIGSWAASGARRSSNDELELAGLAALTAGRGRGRT